MVKKEGWNPQSPGLLKRWPGWCVVVQSSHDDHVTSEGVHITKDMGVHSNQGSGPHSQCNEVGPWGMVGHGQSRLGWPAAWQGRNGVNPGRTGQR